MKASVQDELTIPQQTRFLVPIELGKVERHVRLQNAFMSCQPPDHSLVDRSTTNIWRGPYLN